MLCFIVFEEYEHSFVRRIYVVVSVSLTKHDLWLNYRDDEVNGVGIFIYHELIHFWLLCQYCLFFKNKNISCVYPFLIVVSIVYIQSIC